MIKRHKDKRTKGRKDKKTERQKDKKHKETKRQKRQRDKRPDVKMSECHVKMLRCQDVSMSRCQMSRCQDVTNVNQCYVLPHYIVIS